MSDTSGRSYEPRKTVCPFCGVGCGLIYDDQTGKGTGWEGPVNTCGELCPKGVAAFEPGEHDDRLKQPLVREGGYLVTAPWEEALSRVVGGLETVREEHGADALAFFSSSNCTNEENYLLSKIARALGTNNLDNCARLCHSSTVTAMAERFGAGAMTNTLEDLTEADDLREAARRYAQADRAAAFTGMGMSQHHCGTDNVSALLNLALLTGNVGKRGTGVNPLRGQNNVQGANDVGARRADLPGYEPVTDEEARERVADVWGFEPPSEPGLTEVEMTHEFGESIHAAFVLGENPALSEPNLTDVRRSFEDLEFLAVQDLYVTETAEYADVILPASTWAEKSGTVTNTDRQVQRMRPNASLPGDARRDFEILCDLGGRLTDFRFDYAGPGEAFDEMTAVNPLYEGMTYDAVGESSLRWPFPADAEDGVDDELALTTGRVLEQFNSGAFSRRSVTLVRMRGDDVLEMHPRDAEERGIADGDRVVVENERGSVEVEAAVSPVITPGSVFLTFHYDDPTTNLLTGDALDPEAKIPEYKHSAVTVEPAP